MKTASSSVKLTYDDFVHFPDDGQRHELMARERRNVLRSSLFTGLDLPLERIFSDT